MNKLDLRELKPFRSPPEGGPDPVLSTFRAALCRQVAVTLGKEVNKIGAGEVRAVFANMRTTDAAWLLSRLLIFAPGHLLEEAYAIAYDSSVEITSPRRQS